VSKKDVKARVRSPGARANQRHCEVRTFATTTNALLELRGWLVGQRVTLVAMEATGDSAIGHRSMCSKTT
jgi:transposase